MKTLYPPIGPGRLSIAFGLSLAFTACALGASLPDTAQVGHLTDVKSVCSDVFRFAPMGTEYRACIDSLTQSLADADRAKLADQGRQVGAGNK